MGIKYNLFYIFYFYNKNRIQFLIEYIFFIIKNSCGYLMSYFAKRGRVFTRRLTSNCTPVYVIKIT